MDRQTTSEITVTRVFDAPRELVFKTFTEPERIKRWWGPAGFTSPVAKIDLRPGGSYLYSMRSPDGEDFWSTGTFKEIVPMEKLVYTDSFADEQGNVVPPSHYGMGDDFPPELLVTVIFEDLGGQTRVTLRLAGLKEGEMKDLTSAGWEESFDKVAQALRGSAGASGKRDRTQLVIKPGVQELFVTHTLPAPPELVFKTWLDPDLLPQWWGPARLKTNVVQMDVRPGGMYRIVQRDTDGNEHGFHGVYHDIDAPHRIVQTFEYEGAPGHVVLETALFEPVDGGTRVTLQDVYQSVADRDASVESGMESGIHEMFERVEALLVKARSRSA